jgi:hypothetical protein
VEEETGIADVRDVAFYTAVVSNIEIPVSGGGKLGLLLMVYKVNVPEDMPITLSPEHTAYEWWIARRRRNA